MIICLLIPLSTVSASDINTTDDQVLSATPQVDTLSAGVNLEQENDTLSVQENENILSAGTDSGSDNILKASDDDAYSSISDLVKRITLTDNTLILSNNYKFKSTDSLYVDGITIDKPFTLIGNGYTIDGSKQMTNLFTIASDNVTIKNIKLTNATKSISVNGFKNVTLNDVNVIYIEPSNGGTIMSFSNVDGANIINCHFNQNKGYVSFGRVTDFLISDSTFYNTYYTGTNGRMGILSISYSFINITNCEFINSSIYLPNGLPNTVQVESATAFIDNCKFINNTATDGTIYTLNSQPNTISNSYFENNKARYVIYDPAEYTIYNNTFVKNIPTNGVIFTQYRSIVDNNTFDNNTKVIYTGQALFSNNIIKNTNLNYIIDSQSYNYQSLINTTFENNKVNYLINALGNYSEVNGLTVKDDNIINNGYIITVKNNTQWRNSSVDIPSDVTLFDSNMNILKNTKVSNVTVDSNNISLGVSQLSYDGLLILLPGTYNNLNNIITNGRFNLKGTNRDQVIINSTTIQGIQSVRDVTFNNTEVTFNLVNITAENVVFDNNSQYYTTNSGPNGIFKHVIIRNSPVSILGSWCFSFTFEDITIDNPTSGVFSGSMSGVYYFRDIVVKNANNKLIFSRGSSLSIDGLSIIDSNITSIGTGQFKDLNNIYLENINVSSNLFTTSGMTINNITGENINITTNLFNSNNGDLIIKNVNLNKVNCSNITQNCIVDVNNFTIKSLNASNGFIVNDNSKFNKLNILNSNFTNAIILLGSNSIISDSLFDSYKGHVVINGSRSNVVKTTFNKGNNSDLNGGAVFLNGNSIVFTDCNFTNNNASYGGVFITESSLKPSFVNCNFTNNNATGLAGAIYINSTSDFLILIDTATNKTINPDSPTYNSIHGTLSQLLLKVYVIKNGEGTGEEKYPIDLEPGVAKLAENGELIFVQSEDSWDNLVLDIDTNNLTFYGNNTVLNNVHFNVLSSGSNFKVYNITFKNNTENSAIVWNGTNGEIKDCVFMDNGGVNVLSGAAIQILADHINIFNTSFINNTVLKNTNSKGGALYINASYVDINNCTFKNNTGITGSHLYIENNIRNIHIFNNTQFIGGNVTGALGGGVYVQGNNINITNVYFENNTAVSTFGAAMSIAGNGFNLYVDNCTFKNNTAKDAGAIYVSFSGNNLNIIHSSFMKNNVSDDGGAILIESSLNSPVVEDNLFDGNTALHGGAIYISEDNIILNNNTFMNNNASLGGALYVTGNDVWVYDSRFIGNTANSTNDDRGSAIYVVKDVLFHMRGGILDGNRVFGGNDSNTYYGDISFVNINPDISGTEFTNNPYQQYISNSSKFIYSVAYITCGISKGLGFTVDTATTLETVFKAGFKDNLLLYIVDHDYELTNDLINSLQNLNVTVIGVNNTSIKRETSNTNKYLFIHLNQIK